MNYSSVDEMWLDILGQLTARDVVEFESRAGSCTEVQGFHGVLTDVNRSFVLNPERKLSPHYAMAELLWYLSGEQEIERIRAYAPSYVQFAEGDTAWGAYGWRWLNDPTFVAESQNDHTSQLTRVAELLRVKPNSREAVMTAWNAGDLAHARAGDHADLPCTLALQFLLRENLLHLVVTMRSQDVWLGFPYDVFAFTCLQRLVAATVGARLGSYVHQVGALHLYSANRDRAVAALGPRNANSASTRSRQFAHWGDTPGAFWSTNGWLAGGACKVHDLGAACSIAVAAEERVRTTKWTLDDLTRTCASLGPEVLEDAVRICADRWGPTDLNDLDSPLMREAMMAAR